MTEEIRIVIGTEDAQYVPQQVLKYSIEKNTSHPVEIHCIQQEGERVGGTNFGFVRFIIPSMFNFEGKAIYVDADQLVLTDVEGLWSSLDDEHDIAVVQNAEGFFGDKVVQQCNQTSVMVLNCERLKNWDPKTLFDNVVPNRAPLEDNQIHYRDFIKLDWMDQSRLQSLDPRWNHFNIIQDDSKLVHFSHVRSQPWKKPDHPLTEMWGRWLKKAIRAGYIKRRELWREIRRGHLHKHFLRFVFTP